MRCVNVEVHESSVLFAVQDDCPGVVYVPRPFRPRAEALGGAGLKSCPLAGIKFASDMEQREQPHVIVHKSVGLGPWEAA